MATSVHIPQHLLEAVDRLARSLNLSRNRLIIRALEREVSNTPGWSTGFFERLASTDDETSSAVDHLLSTVIAARSTKPPIEL